MIAKYSRAQERERASDPDFIQNLLAMRGTNARNTLHFSDHFESQSTNGLLVTADDVYRFGGSIMGEEEEATEDEEDVITSISRRTI